MKKRFTDAQVVGFLRKAESGLSVTCVLDHLAVRRALPQVLRADNGAEFFGRTMLTWAHHCGPTLALIELGKPNQNAYIESFNGRFRDEWLNERWFTSLANAWTVIEGWRREYNDERRRRGLGGLTPKAYCQAADETLGDGYSDHRTLNRSTTEDGGRCDAGRQRLRTQRRLRKIWLASADAPISFPRR